MSALEAKLLEARQDALDCIARIDEVIAATKPIEGPIAPAQYTPGVGLQNPAEFYSYIRGEAGELFPVMRESQFLGVEETLKQAAGKLPLSWCAYTLATEYHETAKTMTAVREGLNLSDAWRRKNLRYYPWYGRGEVQLTWERNYKFASNRLKELGITVDSGGKSIDLIANPDQALDPVVSTAVMIHGMLEGWFTGKKLRDYLPSSPSREQYRNARRIINGTDRADLIAGYAIEFEKALKKGDWK